MRKRALRSVAQWASKWIRSLIWRLEEIEDRLDLVGYVPPAPTPESALRDELFKAVFIPCMIASVQSSTEFLRHLKRPTAADFRGVENVEIKVGSDGR